MSLAAVSLNHLCKFPPPGAAGGQCNPLHAFEQPQSSPESCLVQSQVTLHIVFQLLLKPFNSDMFHVVGSFLRFQEEFRCNCPNGRIWKFGVTGAFRNPLPMCCPAPSVLWSVLLLCNSLLFYFIWKQRGGNPSTYKNKMKSPNTCS